MVTDLSGLSVRELHERYVNQTQAVTAAVLRQMGKDPRAGVRRIHQRLKRKQELEKRARQRLAAMLNFERVLWKSGVRHVAGVDEVGIGPLAGPVVAAAVVFPPRVEIAGIDDSKRLDSEARTRLAAKIREKAVGVGIGLAEVAEIDKINIYRAGLCAMKRAVEQLPMRPGHILIDARIVPDLGIPQNPFCKGDGIDFSIAAASIIAKTYRDKLMEELDRHYPRYGFARHKGYSTPEHMMAIQEYGPSPVHRKSFHFIEELCGQYSRLFYRLRERLGQINSVAKMSPFEEELQRAHSDLSEWEYRKLKLVVARRWRLLTADARRRRKAE